MSAIPERIVEEGKQPPITSPRREIYARHVKGFYRTLRSWISAFLQVILFVGPWLNWNGRQAFVLDIPGRKLHLWWWTFWPQETYFLLILLVTAGVMLFAVTAVGGRLWCGYACPQTLLTQSFMMVERWIEGDRSRRMRLDRSRTTWRKIVKKTLKHSIWIGMSIWMGLTLVGYFYPIRVLIPGFLTGRIPLVTYGFVLFFSAASYFDFGFFREQFCYYVCPYGRFQSSMIDQDTILVGYDSRRGEKRGPLKDPEAGDCIDCKLCVQVCPMGIDIRDGLQLECINCAACIDACDSVMERIGRPKGLISYTSLNKLAGKKTRILRPRVYMYALLLLVLAGMFTYLMVGRVPVYFDVVRKVGDNFFTRTADGRVANSYDIKIINRDNKRRNLQLSIRGLSDAELVSPVNPLSMEGESVQDLSVFVVRKPSGGMVQRFQFVLKDLDDPGTVLERSTTFVGPGG